MRNLVVMVLVACGLATALGNQPDDKLKTEFLAAAQSVAQCMMEICIHIDMGHDKAEIINKNYVDELTSMWYTNQVKDEIYDYAERVNQTPQMVRYENEWFPEELISIMEKMVCQPLDREFDKAMFSGGDYEFEDTLYYKQMDRLGAKDTELSVKKIRESYPQLLEKCDGIDLEDCSIYELYRKVYGENCEGIFCYKDDEGEDMFVLVLDSGGSYGMREVCRAKLHEDGDFEIVDYFQTKNAGYGKVISYGNSYYYVFLEYNYNLKIHDRIRLHRLGDAPGEECLVIKYVPESYIWRNTFNGYEGSELDEYIKSIQDDITSNQYLENGMDGDIAVYVGDESGGEVEMCAIDFANIGVLVYIDKRNMIPSSTSSYWILQCKFYVDSGDTEELTELDNAEINASVRAPRLVQMWFKKIGDEVYSFFLYHVEDYNYVLQTALIEGSNINLIRSDVLVPQRHFLIREDTWWLG